MIEKVSKCIEVFSLNENTEVKAVVDAVMGGNIILLRVGSVFSFILNPNIAGLIDKFNVLKERRKHQTMSVVCTYEQAKQIVDRSRVNEDFFRIPAYLCASVIVRIPVDTTITLPFPYNSQERTMQFLNFDEMHPIRNALREELSVRGCEYLSITSANLHGAPTIEDLEAAKLLAALFNIKASFLGMHDIQTVVADIPSDRNAHKGSYIIVSFCNPNAIEVKRLANKTDMEVTDRYLKELFANIPTQTPLVYAL